MSDQDTTTVAIGGGAQLDTPIALGIILVGALLAIGGLRVGFKGAVVQVG